MTSACFCREQQNAVAEAAVKAICETHNPRLDAKKPREYVLHELHVFLPDKVMLGAFGGIRSTYLESKEPPPEAGNRKRFYVAHPDRRTPDGQPLTARCDDWGNRLDHCVVAYPRGDGTHLMFEFSTKRAEIAQRAAALDSWPREFLREFQEAGS